MYFHVVLDLVPWQLFPLVFIRSYGTACTSKSFTKTGVQMCMRWHIVPVLTTTVSCTEFAWSASISLQYFLHCSDLHFVMIIPLVSDHDTLNFNQLSCYFSTWESQYSIFLQSMRVLELILVYHFRFLALNICENPLFVRQHEKFANLSTWFERITAYCSYVAKDIIITDLSIIWWVKKQGISSGL